MLGIVFGFLAIGLWIFRGPVYVRGARSIGTPAASWVLLVLGPVMFATWSAVEAGMSSRVAAQVAGAIATGGNLVFAGLFAIQLRRAASG